MDVAQRHAGIRRNVTLKDDRQAVRGKNLLYILPDVAGACVGFAGLEKIRDQPASAGCQQLADELRRLIKIEILQRFGIDDGSETARMRLSIDILEPSA